MGIHKVWVTLPDGAEIQAGELAFGRPMPDGTCRSAFRYSPEWLKKGFPLDPVSLPLSTGEFHASHLGPPLAVFDDALPDAWGRHLIDSEKQIPISKRLPERYLVEVGRGGLGAIGFGGPVKRNFEEARMHSMAELMDAARDVEKGVAAPDSAGLHKLFAVGASAGGARPKALVAHEGRHWIAKFPAYQDGPLNVPALEFASMVTAKKAGLDCPDVQLHSIGGRSVLFIERFDLTEKGRVHHLSFKSLCKERGGLLVGSYADLMAVVAKHSMRPEADTHALYRQAVFNMAIGNTDDHLKNFMMQGGPKGYCLAPAFDLVPDIARNLEHQLSVGGLRYPEKTAIAEFGARWCRDRELAEKVMQEVSVAVSGFKGELAATGVDMEAHARICSDIDARLGVLAQRAASIPSSEASRLFDRAAEAAAAADGRAHLAGGRELDR